MSHQLFSRSLLVVFGVALLASTGCGPSKGAPVTGKVVLPAKVKLAEQDQIEVTFAPDDPKVKWGATGTATPPGLTFTLKTAEGTGVQPGKYKVGIQVKPYPGSPDYGKRKQAFDDLFNKKYEVGTTTLTFQVPASKDAINLTIDLDKGTVTKD
jgi:hypothetical protein